MSYRYQGRAAALAGRSPALAVLLAARIMNAEHRTEYLDGFYEERLTTILTCGGRAKIREDAMVERLEVWATR